MACSEKVFQQLTPANQAAISQHTTMRRLLAFLDTQTHIDFAALRLEAQRHGAVFIQQDTSACMIQVDRILELHISNTGAASLEFLTPSLAPT